LTRYSTRVPVRYLLYSTVHDTVRYRYRTVHYHSKTLSCRSERPWAQAVCQAYEEAAQLQQSVTPAEHHNADILAPRRKIIYSAGDPSSTVEDLPSTIDDEDLPKLHESTAAPKGIRYIAARVRKMTDWRKFFTLHNKTPAGDQPKLLTHAGHGSVTLLQSDTPLGRQASAEIARTTIRRIIGAQSLGRHSLTTMRHCPRCGVPARDGKALESSDAPTEGCDTCSTQDW
jgi:hypothetical protein